MSDIFLSYARENRETARALAGALERHGWTVWWDRRIPTGKDYGDVIEAQLTSARCVIVLWSKASVASGWVKTEAADALDRSLLVPVFIEKDVRIPLEFRRIQAADLADWTGEQEEHAGLATLVGDLTGILGAPAAPEAVGAPPAVKLGKLEMPNVPAFDMGHGLSAEELGLDGSMSSAYTPGGGLAVSLSPKALKFGLAAAVLVALAFVIIKWGFQSGGDSNNRDLSQQNTQRPTPHTGPTAAPISAPYPSNDNSAQTPPMPAPAESSRIGILLEQLNASDERTRRAATGALKARYASDAWAVEQAVGLLDEAKIGQLSSQGLINVLFFLNSATENAWSTAAFPKAAHALQTLDRMQLGAQAKEEASTLRLRLKQVLQYKTGGHDGGGDWARIQSDNPL
jgi:hypothetical protein